LRGPLSTSASSGRLPVAAPPLLDSPLLADNEILDVGASLRGLHRNGARPEVTGRACRVDQEAPQAWDSDAGGEWLDGHAGRARTPVRAVCGAAHLDAPAKRS
jgi:hypothetical protein